MRFDRPLQGHMIEITPPSAAVAAAAAAPPPSDSPSSSSSSSSSSSLVGLQPMPCYCTGAPLATASSVVVVFTDVYGIEAGHHKVFADCLVERFMAPTTASTTANATEETVAVIIPDLQRGTPILQPWLTMSSSFSFARDMVDSFLGSPGMAVRVKKDYPPHKIEQEIFQMILPFLQRQRRHAKNNTNTNTNTNTTKGKKSFKLSCVGFCFGGWVVGRVLGCPANHNNHTTTGGGFQCGVGIHPSFHPNLLHGERQTTMAERISKPMLLLPAWNDVDYKPNTKVVDIMTANRLQQQQLRRSNNNAKNNNNNNNNDGEEVEPPVVSIEFPTMMHGWVSRGDPTDANVAKEQERALQLTVEFLQKHTH